MNKVLRVRQWILWAKLPVGLAVAAMLLFQTLPGTTGAPAPRYGAAGAEAPRPQSPAMASLNALIGPAAAQASDTPPRLEGVTVTRELDIPHWLRPGEYAWNDEGVPPGETLIVVNIRARVLSVYRGGVEIGRSSIIYGADNKPTPTGTFPILQKNADHVSNLYDAPMPHMLRLTWDGVAIHGSAELADDLATRGCVGLPEEFAELLFGAVRLGDKAIVWSGERGA